MSTQHPDDERAQVLAAIDAAQRALDAARALVMGTGAVGTTLPDASEPDWQRLKIAARHCKVHPETMVRWAVSHGLGRRIDRAWWIDMTRLKAWQNGESYAPIPPETVSFRVEPDAEDPPSTAE